MKTMFAFSIQPNADSVTFAFLLTSLAFLAHTQTHTQISNQIQFAILVYYSCVRRCICSNSWNWTPFSVHRISHSTITHLAREHRVCWSTTWTATSWSMTHQTDRRVNTVVRLPINEPLSMCYRGISECAHKRTFEPKDSSQPWTIVSIEICTGKQAVCLHFFCSSIQTTKCRFRRTFDSSIIHCRYQHLALIDLDEFIIPRYNNTLSELLK